jgi:Proteasome subunit
MEINSVAIHGTIDVIVATRQGIVLASDSRVTKGDGFYRDDAQKVFPVGRHAACVIAGLVGADLSAEGFHLTDTLGAHILALDGVAKDRAITARDIVNVVIDGLDSVSGLLTPSPALPRFVGEVSSVSVDSSGNLDWITLAIPSAVTINFGQPFFRAGTPEYISDATNLGRRFDVRALGQPQVVEGIVRSDGTRSKICGKDPNSPNSSDWCVDAESMHAPIMLEFFRRKRLGTLDDFTLQEGITLAKTLVRATIKAANPSWGVGGPIDVLTVTKVGVSWVSHKPEQKFDPPFRRTLEAIGVMNETFPFDLDGVQCLACSFENVNFYYDGQGRVELIRPIFKSPCSLTLGFEAQAKRPSDVAYLKGLVSGHCDIQQQ